MIYWAVFSDYLHIIQSFTLSLTSVKTVETVCWELTRNVIAHMGFEDCVVYLYDDKRKVLVQIAAHGPKNPIDLDILNPIVIHPGEGIVGSVYMSTRPEIVPDTRLDWRYIVDDQARLSEICVPILHQGRAIGVIDSEHSSLNFYTQEHLFILNTLASIASNKIVKTRAFEALEKLNTELENERSAVEIQNQELRRLNAQLDELIYRLSHDFRTPVIGVLGLVDLIEGAPEKMPLFMNSLRDNMQRLDRILQNIYYYSLNLRKPVDYEYINTEKIIRSVYDELNHPNKAKTTFSIYCEYSEPIYSDATRLRIFSRHILQNALHFAIPNNPDTPMAIDIIIRKVDNDIELVYRDNGPGLPEEFKLLTQTMFNRGSMLSEGAGLGFFLCKEIALKLNAKLIISSEKNKGVENRLLIPLE